MAANGWSTEAGTSTMPGTEVFQGVMDAMDHPVVLLNARTLSMETANRAAREGRTKADVPCYTLLHGRTSRCIPCLLQQSLQTGNPVVREREVPGPDGLPHRFEIHLQPLIDPDGRWTHAIEYWLDITERHHVVTALRRTSRALKALSEFNQQLVRETDETALLDFLCRVLVQVAGYRLAWIGMAEHDAERRVRPVAQRGFEEGYLEQANITWADTDRGRGPTGTAIRTGEPCVVRHIMQDPAYAPWREQAAKRGYASSVSLPLTADGRIVGALNVYAAEPDAFDEEELRLLTDLSADVSYGMTSLRARAIRRVLSAAIEQSADILLITDTAGNITYANGAFERVTGYQLKEVLGCNPRILRSGRQDAAYYRQMWNTLSCGGEWRGRVVNRKKDGTFYTAECWTSPVHDEAGKLTHYVAIQRDVTREEAMSVQLDQANKMEAIGRLAGGVAHDFNNLLTVILGYGELVLDQLPETGSSRKAVTEMNKAATRATDLTRQLLAFSRRQAISPTMLDLNGVIRGMESLLHRVIGEDVRLSTALFSDPMQIKADPGQLEQVIMNLAGNARDAMPHGGTLTITTGRVAGPPDSSSPESAPSSLISLSVADSGEGMDAETMAHIFEPFFTTKEQGKGTGLGLATVYGIVKQSEGAITVDSTIGQGTIFTLTFPEVHGQAPLAAVPDPLRPVTARGESVLVAEDDATVRALTCSILRDLGYAVQESACEAEALKLSDERPDPLHLLVTDVVMPGIGGLELADAIQARHPEAEVLFVSGYSANAALKNRLANSTINFLQKPFSPRVLAERVRDILDRRAQAQPAH